MRFPGVTPVTQARGSLSLRGPALPAGAPVAPDAMTGQVIQVTEVSRPSRCCSGDEEESRDRTGMSCPITAQQQPPIGRERSRLATRSASDAARWSDRDGDAHPGSTGPMGANDSSNANPSRHRECAGHRGAGPFRAAAGKHPQPRPGPGRSSESRPGYGQPHPDGPGTHAQPDPTAGDEPARVQGR